MPGSGCFIFAWVQFSRRTVVVVQTPGLLCADARTASSQTLTNGLCETTAIDIYLISPRRSTVSQRQGNSSSSEFFCFFFQAKVRVMPGAPSLRSLLLQAHPSVPQGRGERGRRWERDGEGRRSNQKLEALWRNTHFSVFSLVCLMNYHSHYMAEEKKDTCFLYHSLRCDGNNLQTLNTPKIWFFF